MKSKLKKLIEQYERENPGEKAQFSVSHVLHWSNKFLLWMTQHAYRPTCTENDRKFLDEIREKFIYDDTNDCIVNKNLESALFCSEFLYSNLKKLVERHE